MRATLILVRAPSKLAREIIARFVKGAPEPERRHETFCCRGDIAGGGTADATGISPHPGSRLYRPSSSFPKNSRFALWPPAIVRDPAGHAPHSAQPSK